jgi:hypothetical protein
VRHHHSPWGVDADGFERTLSKARTGKAGSEPKGAVCGSGDRSSYPLTSAARRSSGWTPVMLSWVMLSWMLPARSGWTGQPYIGCGRRGSHSPWPRAFASGPSRNMAALENPRSPYPFFFFDFVCRTNASHGVKRPFPSSIMYFLLL